MFVQDGYGQMGIPGMTREGFVQYRTETEDRFPLRTDLVTIHASWLYPYLDQHVQARRLFDQYDPQHTGCIPKSVLPSLAYECGRVQREEDLISTYDHLKTKLIALQSIRQFPRTIRLFGNYQTSPLDQAHDLLQVPRNAFMAWIMAAVPCFELTEFDRWWVRFKWGAYAGLRRVIATARAGLYWINQVKSFGMFARESLCL